MSELKPKEDLGDASGPLAGFRRVKARIQERLEPYMLRFPRLTRFLKLALLGLLTIILLWVLQALAVQAPAGPIRSGLLFGGLAALLLHRHLRKAIAAWVLLFIFGSSILFSIDHWGGIRSGEIGFNDSVKGVANLVFNNKVTQDLNLAYTEQFEGVAHLPRRFISASEASSRTGKFAVATGEFYRYLSEVKGQDSVVRKLAIAEIEPCDSGDRGCEIFHLLNYVSKEIKYVNDPRGVFDYIQSPTDTLDVMAGDCEDQTILLMSMLESVGIDSLIVFTEGHAYPMACTQDPIPPRSRYLARDTQVYDFSRAETPYCYPLEPTDEDTRIGYNYDYEAFIFAVDPVTNQHYEFKQISAEDEDVQTDDEGCAAASVRPTSLLSLGLSLCVLIGLRRRDD